MSGDEKYQNMPVYVCHKRVRALKIDDIQRGPGAVRLMFEKHADIIMSAEWVGRFKPQVGGYLVVYDDDYTSFSPAKAFEEGYTPA